MRKVFGIALLAAFVIALNSVRLAHSSAMESYTIALSNAAVGTESSAIDLDGYEGFYLSVTGTGTVQWRFSRTTGGTPPYVGSGSVNGPIEKLIVNKEARYLTLKNISGSTVTAYYSRRSGSDSPSPKGWTPVGVSSFSQLAWGYVSLSTVAADASPAATYRVILHNEGSTSAFLGPITNAATTPTVVGVTMTANAEPRQRQYDDLSYDSKIWLKTGLSYEPVVVEVFKR